MQSAHGDDHPADAAGDGAAPEQAAMMQRLNDNTFADAKFAQALTLHIGQGRPVYAVDTGGLANGKLVETQVRTFRYQEDSASDYQ